MRKRRTSGGSKEKSRENKHEAKTNTNAKTNTKAKQNPTAEMQARHKQQLKKVSDEAQR